MFDNFRSVYSKYVAPVARYGGASSVGEKLEAYKGVGPGFDYLRVALALIIVAIHAMLLRNMVTAVFDSPLWIVRYAAVPMFFALSGFLISGSAGRLSLKNFLINRSLRIVPALAVDTFVCALIIGPLFTTLPLENYFTDPKFFAFFLNIIGWVHYYLPGLFVDHHNPRLNGSLWTVPFELSCYVLISTLIVFKVMTTRWLVLSVVVSYIFAAIALSFIGAVWPLSATQLGRFVQFMFLDERPQCVTGFLFGIAAYQNRDLIPYDPRLFGACLATAAIAGLAMVNDQGQNPIMRLILMSVITYIMMFVGLTPIWLPKFFKSGDYSYGIYLYHQPFLQIAIALLPRNAGAGVIFAAALPFVYGIAWLSWHCIEKPVLAARKRFSIMAKTRGAV